MWAWNTDANEFRGIREEDLKGAFDALLPLQTPQVQQFILRPGEIIPSILVGPKGSGKTFLLAAKSFNARRRPDSGRHVYPSDSLFERVQGGASLKDAVDRRPRLWATATTWRDAWTIALSAVAFEAAGLRKHLSPLAKEELSRVFPEMYATSEHGGQTSRRRHSASFYLVQVVHQFNDEALRSSILRLKQRLIEPELRECREPVLIFLDAPDEAVDQDAPEHGGDLGISCWLELQLGLLLAVRQIQEIKQNIAVFTTLRSEVYHLSDRTPLFQQAKANCLHLNYTNQQLEDIFRKNCEADRNRWTAVASTDPIDRFLGVVSSQQGCSVDDAGDPVQGRCFDSILRHTFYRPRDLMEIGKAIADLSFERRESTVRNEINRVAETLLEHLMEQAYPPWEDAYLDALLFVTSNVFSRRSLEDARRRFFRSVAKKSPGRELKCPFNYLYIHGLLGTIDPVTSRQEFVVDPTMRHDLNSPVPASDWYFLHPSLNGEMERHHGSGYRKNQRVVCGHRCQVPSLLVLEIQRVSRGVVRVLFDGQSIMDDRNSIPKLMLIVIALAVQRVGGAYVGSADLLAAQQALVDEGWLDSAQSISPHLNAATDEKRTDHTKKINEALRALGVTQAIKRSGVRLQFIACEPNAIGFRPELPDP